MEDNKILELAIYKLGREFNDLDLTFHKMSTNNPTDVTSYWPGTDEEDIIVCVFNGEEIHEPFHRQDFFFINYAYRNSYQTLSAKYNNLIVIKENECYVGQPYSGYALRKDKGSGDVIIIGVLIRKDSFFREYLPTLYTDNDLFRFFINPQTNKFSDEFIHLSVTKNHAIRSILELMVIEYADKKEDTQRILKSMLQTLLLEIARRYRIGKNNMPKTISEQILDYMGEHSDVVTLKDIAHHFNYHPNYISSLLHKETGRKFSEILLEKRMERALLLLKNTTLSIEDISSMLGYSNHSNFYKSFKDYYGVTPREYFK